MPAVAAGAVLAGASAFATGVTVFNLSPFVSALLIGASNLALGLVSRALQDRPEGGGGDFAPGAGFSPVREPRTRTLRQPLTAWRLIYGEGRFGGAMTFVESTDDNQFLHMVVTVAAHAVDGFECVWLDDFPIYVSQLDGDGMVTTGRFADKVKLQFDDGTATTQPFADLASATGWGSTDLQRGHAKIYARLEFDQDLFPTAVPQISAWVRGRLVEDPRDSGTRWSPNWALCLRDYMLDASVGLGVAAADFDDTFASAAANTSDEIVTTANRDFTVSSVDTADDALLFADETLLLHTGDRVELVGADLPDPLAASTDYFVIAVRRFKSEDEDIAIRLATSYANALAGTAIDIADAGSGGRTVRKTGEPRYTCNGLVSVDRKPFDTIEDLLTAGGGLAVHSSGVWKISPGHYETPTLTLDEGDFLAPIEVRTRHSRQDRFNGVRGTYVSWLNYSQPSDYPPVTSATYETEDDGQRILTAHDLPFTDRPHMAQRLAKRRLLRHRRQITVEAQCSLKALALQVGDHVAIDNSRLGWSAKPFRVEQWQLAVRAAEGGDGEDGAPALFVSLTLRETASTVDDWSTSEEATLAAAPPTTLPSAFTVAPPTSLVVSTDTVYTVAGDELGYIVFAWAAAADFFVRNGGAYECQFKTTAASDWSESWSVEGDKLSTRIGPLAKGVKYDVRIRARNHLGRRSSWSALTGFTLGATGAGATVQLDYGEFSDPATLAIDYGSFGGADPVTQSFDYEEFV